MDEGLHNLIGHLDRAQAPLPEAAPEALVASPPLVELPDGADAAPGSAAMTSRLAAVASNPAPGPSSPALAPSSPSPRPEEVTEEERALLVAFRLVDRDLGRIALSPVERAFIDGARILFDRLSEVCQEMLGRSVADHLRRIADPAEPPSSAAAPPAKRKRASRPAKRPNPEGGPVE